MAIAYRPGWAKPLAELLSGARKITALSSVGAVSVPRAEYPVLGIWRWEQPSQHGRTGSGSKPRTLGQTVGPQVL